MRTDLYVRVFAGTEQPKTGKSRRNHTKQIKMSKQVKRPAAGKLLKKEALEPARLALHRKQTPLLLMQNPNYFGTLSGPLAKKYAPVFKLGAQKTYYEGLGCIDYNPETCMLGSSVVIKRSAGYGGSPCFGGSREYVRFYVDYDGSGAWTDEGLADFGIYDRGFADDLCYYARIRLTPDRTACCQKDPVLPKVRAILSWNQAPPAGDPDFSPIWGEVKESFIQIAPKYSIWCFIMEKLKMYPKFKPDWPEVYKPDFEVKYLPELNEYFKINTPLVLPQPMPDVLKKSYGNAVPESRIAFPLVQSMALKSMKGPSPQLSQILPGFNIGGVVGVLADPKFNTTFEELRCVSLDRDAGVLHAAVQVKRSSGYSGNLCTEGSKEYVAFYLDFGSGWEYAGTAFVPVHDIQDIPAGGLWYDVAKGVNLEDHRKPWCTVDKVRVRAILSWSTAPTPGDPDYVAHWGDWEECTAEVQPLPAGVVPGEATVVLEKCGGMVVTDINSVTGLATTHLAGSLNGANDSPFYGTIELIAHLFYAGTGWKYRFMVTEPGGAEHPLLGPQTITTDTLGVFKDVVVNPDAEGWLDWLEKPDVHVVGGLLGRYGAYTDGKYRIRMEAKDPIGMEYPDLNGAVEFMVDSKAPVVSINLNPPAGGSGETTGNCADFVIPEIMTGTYSMADDHAGSFSIYVTPSNNAVVHADGNAVSGYWYEAALHPLPNGGRSGTFEIFTANMIKCGYNVRIDAIDRTIVSSHSIGLRSSALQGFCLRKA